MRETVKSAVVVVLVLVCTVVLGVGTSVKAAVTLTATALIMGGTNQPDPAVIPPYIENVARYYIDPTTSCKVATCTLTPVVTTAEFWPVPGWGDTPFDESVAQGVVDLDTAVQDHLTASPTDTVVIFGYSQSATVSTFEKRALAGQPADVKKQLTFVVIGNPNRPNGGFMARIPGLSISPIGFTLSGATPTDTGIGTVDIAFQYDVAADFPRYPLNIFADLNTLAGWGVHGNYPTTRNGYTEEELAQAINNPANRQQYGDTTYITIPAKQLPLTQLLREWGTSLGMSAVTTPIADLVEPTLRVLVERGYDRSTPYGQPAPLGLFPKTDPVKLASDLATAGVAGVKALLADIQAELPPASKVPADRATRTQSLPAGHETVSGKASTTPPRRQVSAAAATRPHGMPESERPRTVASGGDSAGASGHLRHRKAAQRW